MASNRIPENVINVNKMNNGKINVNRNNPKTTGSDIGSNIMQNIVSENRKRKCPGKYSEFHMASGRKSNTSNAKAPSSFFENDPTNSSCERSKRSIASDKILPLSQSEAPSTTSSSPKNDPSTTPPIPLSADIDCPETAGSGIDTSNSARANMGSDNIEDVVTDAGDEGEDSCPLCKENVADEDGGIECENCFNWYHKTCLNMPDEEYAIITENPEVKWFCVRCLAIKANKINWGKYAQDADAGKN